MSRWKLKVVEGLLRGHTNLRTHIFKPVLTQRQDCQLWGPNKKVAYCVSWSGTGTHKIQNLGSYVPEAQEDLEHMRVNGLISLVANTRLGIIP